MVKKLRNFVIELLPCPEAKDSFLKVRTTLHKMMPKFETKTHFIQMTRKIENQRNLKFIY